MTDDLNAQFEQAQKDVFMLKGRPSNDDLLFLYAHYKQGAVGDATGKRPGLLDLKGRAKFDAWAKLKGTPREAAMSAYVAKVRGLLKG